MKQRLMTILIILLFVTGIGIMSYPFVSNWLNQLSQSKAIENYKTAVSTLDEDMVAEEIKRADNYNKNLISNVILTDPFDESALAETTKEYQSLLNINDGIMGYIEISKISVNLAIYHGTSSEVLIKGVGHLEGSSIPVGGMGTHTVVSAHTGLPSARMFDRLTELEIGDVFYIEVLDVTMAYKVDQIKVVEPDNVSDLGIKPDKDYATLITCTPYGVNSHRLLVRGYRIPYSEAINEGYTNIDWTICLIIAVLSVLIRYVVLKHNQREKKKPGISENTMEANEIEKMDV